MEGGGEKGVFYETAEDDRETTSHKRNSGCESRMFGVVIKES